MSRDWDAFGVVMSGISITAVYGWFYEDMKSRNRRELLVALTGAALLQTGLWIGINTNEASAIRRIDMLQEDPHWSPNAVCYLAEARGNLHWLRKEYAEAAKWYERGLALDPTENRFLSQLARMYSAMGNDLKSIIIYKRMEALGQADARIYSSMGILYLQSQQYDNALKYLNMAEKLDSISAHIPLHIGTATAIKENSYQKGLPYFLRAIKLDPYYSLAYHNASMCYKEMGDTVMAQKYFQRYVELSQQKQ
jgi:tetratricopeptide (TPR) repeat protein